MDAPDLFAASIKLSSGFTPHSNTTSSRFRLAAELALLALSRVGVENGSSEAEWGELESMLEDSACRLFLNAASAALTVDAPPKESMALFWALEYVKSSL